MVAKKRQTSSLVTETAAAVTLKKAKTPTVATQRHEDHLKGKKRQQEEEKEGTQDEEAESEHAHCESCCRDPPFSSGSEMVALRGTMPLASKFVGAHVSVASGLHQAFHRCKEIGGASFALFLKSQRRWDNPPLANAAIQAFHSTRESTAIRHILPHGSYLINLANPDPAKREKSYVAFLDDVQRCESLGIGLYNFHPGSTVGQCSVDEGIANIADCMNRAIQATKQVVLVLENMAGQGNVIGSHFRELASIIALIDDKKRVGVCLDTCHLFSAGYDVRTTQAWQHVMHEFDTTVGLSYLKALHLNDSQGGLGSHLDRHENIGKGKIGLECFRFIMNDKRFNDMPLVLETPVANGEDARIYSKEIELLYSLVENKDA